MAILDSIVGGLVVGTIKAGGVAARTGVRVAYGLGEASMHGMRVGEVEFDRQVVLTVATIDTCKAQANAAKAAFEEAKRQRLAAPAQAAPVMVAAPVAAKAAKA